MTHALRFAPFALVLALSPAATLAQTPSSEPPQPLACAGPFAKESSRAKLVAAFGAAHVSDEEIAGAEGETEKVTVLFAGDPARRIEVFWVDAEARARPATIAVKAAGWTGPEGIRTGMALADVARRNGAQFKVNGFGWDYGGYAADLKGRLAGLPGGCSLLLRFAPGVDLSAQTFRPIVGDKKIASDNALLLSAGPTLSEWSISYDD